MFSVPGTPAGPEPSPPGPTGRARVRIATARRVAARTGPFAGGIVAALVAVLAYQGFVAPAPLNRTDVDGAIASALASVTPPPAYSEVVYQQIAPSFVIVRSNAALPVASAAPGASVPAGETPGPGASDQPSGLIGSGVIVDAAGDVLTALHVVAGATAIEVTFNDGSTSTATIASSQPDHDIAVLHPDHLPPAIVPATLGNPRSVRIGDEAYIVGNPFGLAGSMTAGVVSGLNRSFRNPASGQTLSGLIQFDAAANPGSSGGPLLNRAGQVVGIVTALINPTGQDVFVGIGLAVPIDVAGGAAGLPPD